MRVLRSRQGRAWPLTKMKHFGCDGMESLIRRTKRKDRFRLDYKGTRDWQLHVLLILVAPRALRPRSDACVLFLENFKNYLTLINTPNRVAHVSPNNCLVWLRTTSVSRREDTIQGPEGHRLRRIGNVEDMPRR